MAIREGEVPRALRAAPDPPTAPLRVIQNVLLKRFAFSITIHENDNERSTTGRGWLSARCYARGEAKRNGRRVASWISVRARKGEARARGR